MVLPESHSKVYVLTEILSVALGAISAFEECARIPANSFGIWGDGSMGFVMGLALRCRYPDAEIFVIGKSARKLQKFSFATAVYYNSQIPDDLSVNHAFECAGGMGSEAAIAQIVEIISPQGTISLLGVCEDAVSIHTRRALENGLRLLGNSRSDRNDFRCAIELIQENETCRSHLHMLISETIEVRTDDDIAHAFEQGALNDFKTVIKWSL
jgi:ribitol-5-phosphate 2-dehydrogenase